MKRSSKISPGIWTFIQILLIVAVAIFLIERCSVKNNDSNSYTTQSPKENLERHFSKLDGSYTQFRNYIKENLNDPSSFEHVETRYTNNNDGTATVVMKYRGKNAFNAILTKHAKCTLNISTGDFSDVIVE